MGGNAPCCEDFVMVERQRREGVLEATHVCIHGNGTQPPMNVAVDFTGLVAHPKRQQMPQPQCLTVWARVLGEVSASIQWGVLHKLGGWGTRDGVKRRCLWCLMIRRERERWRTLFKNTA